MKKIISIILCFALVFALVGIVDAKKEVKETCDTSFMDPLIIQGLSEINSNPQYLEFIENSKYSVVKILVDKREYYFVYEEGAVKQTQNAEEDFSVKINCNQMKKLVEAYNNQDSNLIKMVVKQIPLRVKVNLARQCMKTEWCKNQIF